MTEDGFIDKNDMEKINDYINQHPTIAEDLEIASKLIEKKRPVVAYALEQLAQFIRANYDVA